MRHLVTQLSPQAQLRWSQAAIPSTLTSPQSWTSLTTAGWRLNNRLPSSRTISRWVTSTAKLMVPRLTELPWVLAGFDGEGELDILILPWTIKYYLSVENYIATCTYRIWLAFGALALYRMSSFVLARGPCGPVFSGLPCACVSLGYVVVYPTWITISWRFSYHKFISRVIVLGCVSLQPKRFVIHSLNWCMAFVSSDHLW